MYALISDIHANLEALTAVLADIDQQGIQTIHCLGDVVGYGPNPAECADLVRERCTVTVLGNHEEALLGTAWGFGNYARQAIDWTREQLKPSLFSSRKAKARWAWLESIPLTHRLGPDLLVHGSPRNPTSEYLLAHELAYGDFHEKYHEIFGTFERLLFVGHTHLPCVITDRREVLELDVLNNTFEFPESCESQAIVNVGSVGQPRDRNTRASYVVVDGTTIRWRRVPYDHEQTCAKIKAIPALADVLGERLLKGL